MSLVDELNARGTTVIAITHDMNLVAEHAQRVVVMAGGCLVGDGSPREIFARSDMLERAHLRPPQAFRITRELPGLFSAPALSGRQAAAALPPRVAHPEEMG